MKKLVKDRYNNKYLIDKTQFFIISENFHFNNLTDICVSCNKTTYNNLVSSPIEEIAVDDKTYQCLLDLANNFCDTFDKKKFIIHDVILTYRRNLGFYFESEPEIDKQLKQKYIETGQKYNKMSNIITSIINIYEKAD